MSAEPFLLGAGFSYSSSDYIFFSIFLAACFFLAGRLSSSLSESFFKVFFLGSTLMSLEAFLGLGFCYDYSYYDSAGFTAFLG